MRQVAFLGLAALAAASLPVRDSAAQGLLHKHRHVAAPGVGTVRPLPARVAPITGAAVGDASSSITAGTAGSPSHAGAVGGSFGTQPPVDLAIDALPMPMPMPMPMPDGGPPTVGVAVPPFPGNAPGFTVGDTVSIGGWPDAVGSPAGPGPTGDFGNAHATLRRPIPGQPPFHGPHLDSARATATALPANASGRLEAGAVPPPMRNAAGGLPGRAVGLRPGSLDVQGRRPMPGPSASSSGPSQADIPRTADVIQTSGGPRSHKGPTGGGGGVASPATGPSAAATTALPRWRDRIRFAWPTSK